MSEVSVTQALSGIFQREKGYVDHPKDKGGPTKYGITIGTLEHWRGQKLTADDVKKLTKNEANRIYWNMYVKPVQFILGKADQKTADLIIDSAVHHGPEQTIKWVQRALEVEADAKPGPQTIDAWNQADLGQVYQRVYAQRKQLIDQLSVETPEFEKGWQKRIGEFNDAR